LTPPGASARRPRGGLALPIDDGRARIWEEETLRLIAMLDEDKRPKAETRLRAAQRAVERLERQIQALRITIHVARVEAGLEPEDEP
jgi:hypothetical protein